MKKVLLTFMMISFVVVASAADKGGVRKCPELQKSGIQEIQNCGKRVVKKNPRKEDDVIVELSFTQDDLYYQWYDLDDASFWYLACYDDNYEYLLRIAYEKEKQTGTVTYDELNMDYSYMQNFFTEDGTDYVQYIFYQEGTQFDIEEEDGNVVITGDIIGDDGITYRVHVCRPIPEGKDYIIKSTDFTQAEYDPENKLWNLSFVNKNDDWKVCLALNSEDGSLRDNYTIEDVPQNSCYAENLDDGQNHVFTQMDADVILPIGVTNPARGCYIDGWGKDADGNYFDFNLKNLPPFTPKEIVDVDVDVTTSEWPSKKTGGSYYELTETAQPCYQWTLSLSQITGTATATEGIDLDATLCTNTETGETMYLEYGYITQTFDAESQTVSVDAQLVMTDSIQWNFSFTVPVEVKGEKTLEFNDLFIDTTWKDQGSQSLIASTDSIRMDVSLLKYAKIPATYTSTNCVIALGFYSGSVDPETVESKTLYMAYSELAEDGSPVFHARFKGKDKIVYTINACNVVPDITDTVYINRESCYFTDMTPNNGGFSFQCDGDTAAWIMVNSGREIQGHYTMNETSELSYIGYLAPSKLYRKIYISDADYDVTYDGLECQLSGNFHAGCHLVCLNLNAPTEGIEDIDASTCSAQDGKFLRNHQIVIRKSGVEYNVLGQRK